MGFSSPDEFFFVARDLETLSVPVERDHYPRSDKYSPSTIARWPSSLLPTQFIHVLETISSEASALTLCLSNDIK